MSKRFALVFAGLTFAGCAVDGGRAPSAEPELAASLFAQIEDGVAAQSCQQAHLACVVDAGLRPLAQTRCALDFTACVTEAVGTSVECSLDQVGCTIEGALTIDVSDVVDCQQAITDCVSTQVDTITGVNLDPIFEPVNDIADEIATDIDTVIDPVIPDLGDLAASCNGRHLQCIVEAGLRPIAQLECAQELTICVTEAVGEAIECSAEELGCFPAAVENLSVAQVIDCQQAVNACIVDQVAVITGIDVTPVLTPINDIADELGDAVDNTIPDVVDVIRDQNDCNLQAAECLIGNLLNFQAVRFCRTQFFECTAEVLLNIGNSGSTPSTPAECDQGYSDCRDAGISAPDCAVKLEACYANL